MKDMLEEYNNLLFGYFFDFLFKMNDILILNLEFIFEVFKVSLGNFFYGKLNKEEIFK